MSDTTEPARRGDTSGNDAPGNDAPAHPTQPTPAGAGPSVAPRAAVTAGTAPAPARPVRTAAGTAPEGPRSTDRIPIITDGTFFVKSLKNELIQQGTLIDSKVYRFAEEANEILINAHLSWMDDAKFHEILQEYPELLLTIAY